MYEDNKSFPHKKLSQKFYQALQCAILYHDEVPLLVQNNSAWYGLGLIMLNV